MPDNSIPFAHTIDPTHINEIRRFVVSNSLSRVVWFAGAFPEANLKTPSRIVAIVKV